MYWPIDKTSLKSDFAHCQSRGGCGRGFPVAKDSPGPHLCGIWSAKDRVHRTKKGPFTHRIPERVVFPGFFFPNRRLIGTVREKDHFPFRSLGEETSEKSGPFLAAATAAVYLIPFRTNFGREDVQSRCVKTREESSSVFPVFFAHNLLISRSQSAKARNRSGEGLFIVLDICYVENGPVPEQREQAPLCHLTGPATMLFTPFGAESLWHCGPGFQIIQSLYPRHRFRRKGLAGTVRSRRR